VSLSIRRFVVFMLLSAVVMPLSAQDPKGNKSPDPKGDPKKSDDKKADPKTPAEPPADVREAIANLKSKDPKLKIKACDDIRVMGEKAALTLEALCGVFPDPNKKVVQSVLETIDLISPELYKHVSIIVLDQQVPKVVEAVERLGKMEADAKPTLPLLVNLMKKTSEINFAKTGCLGLNGGFIKLNGEDPFDKNARFFNGNLPFTVGRIILAIHQIDPDEPEALKLIQMYASAANKNIAGRYDAFCYLEINYRRHPDRVKMLLPLVKAGLGEREYLKDYLISAGKLGPEAKELAPIVKKLTLSPNQEIRESAEITLKLIEE
jgi:hypothetical protein